MIPFLKRFCQRPKSVWTPARYEAPTVPTPPGWRIVRTMGDVTCYEVRRRLHARTNLGRVRHISGTNDREYLGFPAGTLVIGGCVYEPPAGPSGPLFETADDGGTLILRLDYRAAGWRLPGAPPLPACDYDAAFSA